MFSRLTILLGVALAAIAALAAPPRPLAATSTACQSGDFRVVLPGGRTLSGYNGWKIAALDLPSHSRFQVLGRYVEFSVDVSDFAIYDYTLTGAANPLDITGGVRTPIFASKVPDLKGASLDAGELEVQLSPQSAVIRRRGSAGMKIQAKDCAQGGVFQLEPDQNTTYTHVLAPGMFYFTNPATGKINFGNGTDFRGKDSPQSATKTFQSGDTTVWNVLAGGRLGMVLGEDAVELSTGATPCVQDCQAQNQIRGSIPVPPGA
jgi:hypothetical protein